MGSVHWDSELMTNYVAAVPVPAGSHFVTCVDPATRYPVVFALSNEKEPRMQLIKQDEHGLRQIIDLNKALAIPHGAVIQTFEVQQAQDYSVFLVLAVKYDDRQSNLLVVKPFQIASKVVFSLFPTQLVGTVFKIFMSPPLASTKYPLILLASHPLKSVEHASDIVRVSVSVQADTWTTSRDLELPLDAVDIFSIAPATSVYGEGLFVLCAPKGTSQRMIIATFVRKDRDNNPKWFTVSLKCPPGSSSIASFLGPDNGSALVVACSDSLRYFDEDQATTKDAHGVLVAASPLLNSAQQLFIAQDGPILSLWTSNTVGQLSYMTTRTDTIGKGSLTVCPLLENGKAKSFAPCIIRPDEKIGLSSTWQLLLTNDDHGHLTLLQQYRDTGIWKSEPFHVSYPRRNVEVESYTISIEIKGIESQPLRNGLAFMAASSATTATLNGSTVMLSSSGSWLQADSAGELSLIVPTNSLAGQTLLIKKLRDQYGIEIDVQAVAIDPTRKVISALEQFSTKQSLLDARTKDKKSIWEGQDMPSEGDLEQAAKCFNAISRAHKELAPSTGSLTKPAATMVKKPATNTNLASQTIDGYLMDAFYWLKQKAHDAVDWIVDKIDGMWQFVCKIGHSIKTFVLDRVEKIGEAASWVWQKIRIGWEKLKDLVGFLFDWDDILETKSTISTMVNSGLEAATSKIDEFVPQIDSFFQGIQAQMVKALAPPSKSISGENQALSGGKSSTCQNSTGFKWAGERLKNGGAGSGGVVVKANDPKDPAGAKSWESDFAPLLGSIEAAATQTGKDITELFKMRGAVTTEDLLSKSSNFVVRVLEVIKQFAISVVKSVRRLIELIKQLGNASIDLPIFTWLYRQITHGHDLTLIDAIALIVAIPTTMIIKAVTKKKPPRIPEMSATTLPRLIAGDETLPQSMRLDFNTLTTGMVVGVIAVKGVWSLVKITYKAVTEGSGGVLGELTPGRTMTAISVVLDIVGTISAMPNDPGLPGLKLRRWISYLTLLRASTNGLGLIVGENPMMEKVALCIDLVTCLTNFGLYSAVYYYEYDESWKDKDDETTTLCVIGNGLNALAGIGSFAANLGKLTDPPLTAVGVAVMAVGTYGLMAMEGFMFERTYDKKQQVRNIAPAI